VVGILNFFAMALAIYGSKLFVDGKFERGGWVFMVGNTINMSVALAIGNIWLFIAQAALMFYTINIVENRRVLGFLLLGTLAITAVSCIEVAGRFVVGVNSIIDAIATTTAVFGAWAMSRSYWRVMAYAWIVADLGFMYLAVHEGLVGLFIQSTVFVYHGYKRLKS
jgi:hypothetical protein